jgi:hypothetical protein
MGSRVVRFPQVRVGAASEAVGRRLAGSGVVGSWLGTRFSGPPNPGRSHVVHRYRA